MPKNNLESINFANFEEVVHSVHFGRSDNDMLYGNNAYFQYIQTRFDAQLDQKILDGINYICTLLCLGPPLLHLLRPNSPSTKHKISNLPQSVQQ